MRKSNENISEKRYCINCGKELITQSQKLFCSHECTSSYKKGKPVGKYSKERIDNIQKVKKKNYIERTLLPLQSKIREVLSWGYINSMKRISEVIEVPRAAVVKYFNNFPEDYKTLQSIPKYPEFIRLQDLQYVTDLRSQINKYTSEIPVDALEEISKEFNINLKTLKKFCEVEGKIISSRLCTNQDKVLQLLKDAHMERYFESTLYFHSNREYNLFLSEIGEKYGVGRYSIKKYIKENNIPVSVSYYEKRKILSVSTDLGVSEEELLTLISKIKESSEYYYQRINYKEILDKHIESWNKVYPDKSYSYLLEKLMFRFEEIEPELKRKRLEFKGNSKLEAKILREFGSEFLNTLKEKLDNCDESNYQNLLDEYSPIYGTAIDRLKDVFDELSPNAYKVRRKFINCTTSIFGGSTPERWLQKVLKELKVDFTTQYKVKSNKKYGIYKVDFLIDGNKCVEVQGDYWHANPLFFKNPNTAINSVFPNFKYPTPVNTKIEELTDIQKQTLVKDVEKYNKLSETFGVSNLYYIWEYDINNYPEEVKKFITERLI